MRCRTFLALAALLIGLPAVAQQPLEVRPTLETQQVLGAGAVTQGAALWVHPTDPANSLLLVADAQSGLLVYRLAGTQPTLIAEGGVLGVDVQEGVTIGGIAQTLVMVANQPLQGLVAYVVEPSTLTFRGAGIPTLNLPGFAPSSVALYASPVSGRLYAFAGSTTGDVRQFELTAQADGGAAATLVRSFDVGDSVVGLAVDDALRALYIVEQNAGIWRYDAEPTGADARNLVEGVVAGGLAQPLGGVALYTAPNGRGYLLAASGGENALRVYARTAPNSFLGSVRILQEGTIDAVEQPRHLAVSNRGLGTDFPQGLVAVSDSVNGAENENFKLIPWQRLANAFTPPLLVDTGAGPVTDGGTADGGGGGVINVPPGFPGELPPGVGEDEGSGCNCASASVPGSVLLVLAGMLLLSRRRGS